MHDGEDEVLAAMFPSPPDLPPMTWSVTSCHRVLIVANGGFPLKLSIEDEVSFMGSLRSILEIAAVNYIPQRRGRRIV